jgi:signal transduction histidine kinase/DNA-binding response OmpR family regulator
VSEATEGRRDLVRKQARMGLAVTLFLSFLTLAFAGVAMHHLKQLRERRLALEELAEKLRQSRREAEAASEAKSAFLANMSHEIRTPFHGLMGMLSLLRETGLTARQVDYLRTATESADHLLALLNDILDMSQLEAGRMSLAPAPSDVRALLRDVEALMRPQANAKALSLHFDAAPGVPERVMLDPTRVKQILFNLLSNAIKFSEHGTVVLDVQVRPASSGAAGEAPAGAVAHDGGTGQRLQFIVTDTGVGMDAATLDRLFKRFSQGDSSPQRRHGGTGLGLEISRNLARLMHGDITVRSKPGQGSNFTFDMPLVPLPDASLNTTLPRGLGDDGQRPLRVLVAEDHPVNRQYLAALLDNLGHQCHFTANGQEAVQAAREQPFDVVLMDLHMPVLDGIGATKAIRALPDRGAATVPIVALTADAFEQTRDRCLVAGMNDFLTKPVSPQKLASSLRRLFGTAAGMPAQPRSDKPVLLPAASDGQPLIDTAALQMALQAMSAERLSQMIEAFLEQGPQTVQRLRAAVRDAQPLELRVNAHAAKGAALNLGLSALAATASALHEGAAHLPAHEVARLVQRYEELLPLTRRAVQAAGLMAAGTPAAA